MASDNQPRQIVFGISGQVISDDHPIDLDQIKKIGLYTKENFTELKDLYFAMLDVLHRDVAIYELFRNQQIQIRITPAGTNAPETTDTDLTTYDGFPDDPGVLDRRRVLFFVDFVSIALGLAKTLRYHFPESTEVLKLYTENFNEEDKLKEWGRAGNRKYISQRAIQYEIAEVRNLLVEIFNAIREIENYGKEKPEESTSDETAPKPPPIPRIETALLPPVLQPDEPVVGGANNQTDLAVDLEAPDIRKKLAQEKFTVLMVARVTLFDEVLRRNGLNPDALPPELQGTYQELTRILERELDIIISELSPSELNDLLTGTGNILQRRSLFEKLLKRLANRPENGFFVLYIQFFQAEVALMVSQGSIEQAQETIETVVHYFETEAEKFAELQQIHKELLQWKAQLIKQYQELQKQRDDQVAEEPEEEEAVITTAPVAAPAEPEIIPDSLPDAPPVAPVVQIQQIINIPSYQQVDRGTQSAIQNRSGHIVWGTLAQLFTEDDLRKNTIPPHLYEAVTKATAEYLAGLTPDQLRTLAKSPSSLIRHIKNITGRIQTDVVFFQAYTEFQSSNATPAINRVERIDLETTWASKNLKYELFTAHNITDEVINQSVQLQREYRDVEHDLEVKLYAIFLTFSTEYLQVLYLNPNERQSLMTQLQRTLKADPKFLRELSEFYTELIEYMAEHNQIEEQREVVESLRTTCSFLYQEGGIGFTVTEVRLTDAHQLFMEQLRKSMHFDTPTDFQNATNALDGLLITYGLDETTRLINGVNADLLGLTFGLPQGMVTVHNHTTFREILGHYAIVRVVNLVPAEQLRPIGIMNRAHAVPSNATSLVRHLEPAQNVSKMVEEDGAEKVTLALNGGTKARVQALGKVLGQKWGGLNLEERAAVYLYFDKPFDNSLKIRLHTHNVDVVNERHLLVVFLEYAGFNDNLLPELLKDARLNKFQRLTGTLPPPQPPKPDEHVQQFYTRLKQTKRLEAELAYAELLELGVKEQAVFAARYAMTVGQLLAQYEAAILFESELLFEIPEIDALDSFAEGEVGASGTTPVGKGKEGFIQSRINKKIGALKAKATGKIKEKLAQSAAAKAAMKVAAKAAAAASVVGTIYTVGSTILDILRNKRLRELLIGLGTFATAFLMGVLGNIAGAITFFVVSFLGGFTPLAMLGGLALGQVVSAALPNLRWLPESRMPPNVFTSTEHSAAGGPSMSQLRGKAEVASTNALDSGAEPSSAAAASTPTPRGDGLDIRGPDGSALTGPAPIAASVTTASTVSSGIFGQIAALPIAIVAPTLAMSAAFILSILVITVIAGAFMAPVPTKPGARKTIDTVAGGQATSKYVTITKTPSIGGTRGEIQNRTPVDVTYEITIAPKAGYAIKPTAVKDVFTGLGGTTDLQSKIDISQLPTEPIKEPITLSYTINTGSNFVDALVLNAFTLSFDAYDYTGYVLESNQSYTTTASIYIGNPKVGCWPTNGRIGQLPGGSYSHQVLDAFDIMNEIGTPVYAPFPGTVCDKGHDPKPSGGYGLHASLEFTINGQPLVLYFGHFIKSPRDLMTGLDSRGCKAVNAGEVIGIMDDTGFSSGSHLHYELRPNNAGIKLKDLHPDGQVVINRYNSGERPVTVNHCFK